MPARLPNLVIAPVVLAVVLALGGCGVEEEVLVPRPTVTGAAVVVKPLDALDGASRESVRGVGVDVPAGVVARTTELSETITQLVLTTEGQDRADLVLTVEEPADGRRTDSDVDVSLQLTEAQVGASGTTSDLEQLQVTWPTFEYAVGLRGRVDAGAGQEHPFLLVATRDEAGTRAINVSVEAPSGSVEDSAGYAMLRTLRVDEGS